MVTILSTISATDLSKFTRLPSRSLKTMNPFAMHRVFLFFFFCANLIVVERKGNLLYSKTNLFVKFAMKKEENRGEENKGFKPVLENCQLNQRLKLASQLNKISLRTVLVE